MTMSIYHSTTTYFLSLLTIRINFNTQHRTTTKYTKFTISTLDIILVITNKNNKRKYIKKAASLRFSIVLLHPFRLQHYYIKYIKHLTISKPGKQINHTYFTHNVKKKTMILYTVLFFLFFIYSFK